MSTEGLNSVNPSPSWRRVHGSQTSDIIRPPETPENRRHGAPAGPWPWIDFSDHQPQAPAAYPQQIGDCAPNCLHFDCGRSWRTYPTNLFPNWSADQVERSGIAKAINTNSSDACEIDIVDIFNQLRSFECQESWIVQNGQEQESWDRVHQRRSSDVRVRALFLDRPTGDAIRMIGTKYNIEPFFFSSALNRIPCRYQEEARHQVGDHLLAIHVIRDSDTGTIISYHPENEPHEEGALHLLARVVDAGESVYWQDILRNTSGCIFIVLVYLWYVLYAWDEAFEELFKFISNLETQSINSTDIHETKLLHNIRAHLLQYTSLLRDFELSVRFLRDTPHPGDLAQANPQESQFLSRECDNLLAEIARFEMGRTMYTKRLKNVMNLAFSTVAIFDSSQMRLLTENAAKDR
ncbi:hypothetical protein AX16_009438 [Volvariella volvacea WC 439]|nr:hypothetical protein AX16_009438 [Volvariella volvacea WC 439]